MSSDKRELILNLAAPIVKSLGLEIWGLEIVSGPREIARLYVDVPPEKSGTDCRANNDKTLNPSLKAGSAAKDALEKSELICGDMTCSATIDQCEEISRRLGLALEVEDPFAGAWILEVSSPGLERKFFSLEQMRPYIGDIVEAVLSEPLSKDFWGNRKSFRGKLLCVGEDGFELELCSIGADGAILPENVPVCEIPWRLVRKVSRIHIFNATPKPGKIREKKKRK